MKNFARRLKIQDNINTDDVVPGRRVCNTRDPALPAGHIFGEPDAFFSAKVRKGDILVAGRNFGSGSSCDQAPQVLKAAGFGAVAAKSFARIFYRNAFNAGLPLIECNTDFLDDGDEIELELANAKLWNRSKGLLLDIAPLPTAMKTLLKDGGVINHYKKHGGLRFE